MWSPDGSQLVFLSFDKAGAVVRRYDFLAGKQDELTHLSLMPSLWIYRMLAWSPDGKRLAVSDLAPHSETVILYRISLDGSRRQPVTQPIVDRTVIDVEPAFSPDGRSLAFVRMVSHQLRDVDVADLATGKMRSLAQNNRVIGELGWSPDGTEVIFSSRRERDFRLWTVTRDGGAVRPHASGLFADNPIEFSFQAGRLAYTVSNQNPNIWRLDLSSSRWEPWAASTGEDLAPQVSPDNARVAFVSDRSGEEQLWLADIAGHDVRQVTGDLRPALGRWSPEGGRIFFNASEPTTHVLNVASGRIEQITVTPRISLCAFSPDSRFLVGTVTMGGQRQLIRARVEGGDARPVVEGGFFAQYSPDGKTLYFVKNRQAQTLWRMPAIGGSAEKVDLKSPLAGFGLWAIGKYDLYSVTRGPDGTGWWVVRSSLKDPSATYLAQQHGDLPPFGAGFLSVSPDERYLWTVWANAGSSDLLEAAPKP